MGGAVRHASATDRKRLAAVLAQAFADDPVWGHLIPVGARHRDHRLRWFFAEELARSGREGGVWMSAGGDSVAVWYPPGRWRASRGEMLRQGPVMAAVFGSGLALALRVQQRLYDRHPLAPHWYLALLATAPARQGTGLGAALLQPMLQHCDQHQLPAYLEATSRRSRRLYVRHGFEDLGQPLALPGGGPLVSPLWREPHQP